MVKFKNIAMMISKKGSLLASLYSDAKHLVQNAVIVNPTNIDINIGDILSGQMIYNNNGFNTFIVIGKEVN